ncbi:hypothetical protein, partial [Streptomyces sp. NPDC006999]|uniref:hypothetical protein n=1 Tax=Streptomyces sp. NPDC006999 TaxID=3156909 RepID=UPI0033E92108
MLEPTEPTKGSEENSPSDTLPPRRRRRAASRPAGPPAAASGTTDPATAPAIPAAEAARSLEPLEENDELEAVEGTGSEPAAAPEPVADRAETPADADDAAPRKRAGEYRRDLLHPAVVGDEPRA